jgi:hypothetical protein
MIMAMPLPGLLPDIRALKVLESLLLMQRKLLLKMLEIRQKSMVLKLLKLKFLDLDLVESQHYDLCKPLGIL